MIENAQLIGLSRQMSLQRQMDVVANNLANMNTTGFKAEQILFEEFVMPVARDGVAQWPDQSLRFSQDWATLHDFTPGALVQTGNPLDVALSGDGFFVVETTKGDRWTRAGAFQLDATGALVDLAGNRVMGDGGAIVFGAEETDIAISADGTVSSSAGLKGRLMVVDFDDPQALTRAGANLWAGGEPVAADGTAVLQGMIERSNVSGVAEMTEMIRVQRAYQSLASLTQRQDELRRTAIQRLGDLNA